MNCHVEKMMSISFWMTNTTETLTRGKKKLMHITWLEIDVTA